ncbi:unnamed protein product [Dovyalis caffra]|uniref:Uncharacterized protein n=1 Tax=Dovyalis caffra TaxID=77055 RepID=A0AAV1SDH0_9ROSI|nr:unnamed protein product [Dovyalis caffra]
MGSTGETRMTPTELSDEEANNFAMQLASASEEENKVGDENENVGSPDLKNAFTTHTLKHKDRIISNIFRQGKAILDIIRTVNKNLKNEGKTKEGRLREK